MLSSPAAVTMLKLLRIKNIAAHHGARAGARAGPDPPDRRDRARESRSWSTPWASLLGARASADLDPHRRGQRGRSRRWSRARGARAALERTACPREDDEIVVRREVAGLGQGPGDASTARWCPSRVLRELAPLVAAIHGQHEPQGLLDPEHPPRPRWTATPGSTATRTAVARGLSRALREVEAALRVAPPRPPRGRAPAGDARVPGGGDRAGGARSRGRGGRCAQEKARAGQRRAAGRAVRARPTRSSTRTRTPCSPRLRPGRTARSRSSRRIDPRFAPLPRGRGPRCGPSSRTWPSSCATTAKTLQVSPGPARRDREPAGARSSG